MKDSGEAMGSHFGRKHMHTSKRISKCGFPVPGRCRTNAPDIHRQGGCCWGSRLLSLPLAPERLVMRKRKCGNGVKGWSRASSVRTLQPCILSTSRFLMHGAGRRSRHHIPGGQEFPLTCGMTCTHQPMIGHY